MREMVDAAKQAPGLGPWRLVSHGQSILEVARGGLANSSSRPHQRYSKKARPAHCNTYQNTKSDPGLFLHSHGKYPRTSSKPSLADATRLHIADVERNRVVGAM